MSNLPGQSLSIRDPGLGLSAPSGNVFALLGTSSAGTPNVMQAASSAGQAVDLWGEGNLPEAVAQLLDIAGGPVYGVKLDATVSGTVGSVSKTAVGTSTGTLTIAGTPNARYDIVVEITTTGTLGVAEFRYSLDGGRTFSESRVVPLGGAFTVPRTGVTLTFTPGAGPTMFERGDAFKASTTGPYYSSTEVSAAFDAIDAYLSSSPSFSLDAVGLLGRHPTGTAAATIFATVASRLSLFEQSQRYLGAMVDAGSADTRANVKAALAAVADSRVLAAYGDATVLSAKPFAGFGAATVSAVVPMLARAAQSLPSTSLGRVADGPLDNVLAISHDEYVTEEMDAAKIATLRTHPGHSGFFITDGRMKSPIGSDFKSWQYRRVMDLACRTVVSAQAQFTLAEVMLNPDGTIEEKEARRIEAVVKDQLRAALSDPKNASGRRGYVSAFDYTVDRIANVSATSRVATSVSIVPLGYGEWIVTDIGFARSLGAGA